MIIPCVVASQSCIKELNGVAPMIKPLPLPLVWHSFKNAPNARKFQSPVNSGPM
jgi:hypothetical protein